MCAAVTTVTKSEKYVHRQDESVEVSGVWARNIYIENNETTLHRQGGHLTSVDADCQIGTTYNVS